MSIYENLNEFAGRPVKDFDPEVGLADPKGVAYRIRLDYDESDGGGKWLDKFAALTASPEARELEALVVGTWEDVSSGTGSVAIVEGLAAARDKLPGLRHLFFGDIISEECEISWIEHGDFGALLGAYPGLVEVTIRGGSGLSLGRVRMPALRKLAIQAGGLPPAVIHDIAASELPSLEHLELWLGEPDRGGDATVDDLAPLLAGDRFPKLKYLGLKNSVIQDDVAAVLANAPVLGRLETLDLSQGALGDEGARALLASPLIRKLKKLDLRHHFISDDLAGQLKKIGGVEVDVSEKQEPHEWGGEQHRYISVSE